MGGTIFYIKTWLEGGLSPIPEIPLEIQNHIRHLSKDELISQILCHDPEILNFLHKNDTQRLSRALAVKWATGMSIRTFQTGVHKKRSVPVHLMDIEKSQLHRRIEERTHKMIQNGAIEEVENLLHHYPDFSNFSDILAQPIRNIIGLAEIIAYLTNVLSKEQMIEKIILLTKQYAKRQRVFCQKIVTC